MARLPELLLEKYAKENGFRNPRFFVDDRFSGVTFTRPSFMEMVDLAEQGEIGTIIVKDHSRLGHNRLLYNACCKNGIKWQIFEEGSQT